MDSLDSFFGRDRLALRGFHLRRAHRRIGFGAGYGLRHRPAAGAAAAPECQCNEWD